MSRTADPPSEVDEHADCERRENQRHELRGRQRTDAAAFVAAIELDDVSRDRVEQYVKPERPPGELPAHLLGGQQEYEDEQFGAGFIQLRRMQRDVERRPDVRRRK